MKDVSTFKLHFFLDSEAKMYVLQNLFSFCAMSILTFSCIHADDFHVHTFHLNQTLAQRSMNSQTPNMRDERSFREESLQRLDQLKQSNLNMIERDRQMRQEGYDVNQGDEYQYPSSKDENANRSFINQEEWIRGQV